MNKIGNKVIASNDDICYNCRGTGVVTFVEPSEVCRVCNGIGKDNYRYNESTIPGGDGTGEAG